MTQEPTFDPKTEYADLEKALASALRSVRSITSTTISDNALGKEEIRELLHLSAGRQTEEDAPWYRPAYAAADYVYADPRRFKKGDGVEIENAFNSVVTLLRRQVRLDKTPGVSVPSEWSAEALLEQVLETSPGGGGLRRADLQAI